MIIILILKLNVDGKPWKPPKLIIKFNRKQYNFEVITHGVIDARCSSNSFIKYMKIKERPHKNARISQQALSV